MKDRMVIGGFVKLVCIAVMLGMLDSNALAQEVEWEIDPDQPAAAGQWAGPWDLGLVINPQYPTKRDWNEIAHAILLPRKSNDGQTKVLLICRRDEALEGDPGFPVAAGFIWDPADPASVTPVPLPTYPDNPTNINQDPFCGGHAFTPEGDVLFAGGTNTEAQISLGGAWGHAITYAFVNDESNYRWIRLSPMRRARWYPTVTTLNDGSFLVAGHDQNPVLSPATERTFERGTVIYLAGVPDHIDWQPLPASDPVLFNVGLEGGDCQVTPRIFIGGYPRQHSLRSGQVIWTGISPPDDPPFHSFFDLFACPTDPDYPHRWIDGTIGAFAPQNAARGSVHLIDLSGVAPVEVVYDMGGGLHESEHSGISSEVVRMLNPGTTAEWVEDDGVAPDLTYNVLDGNFVVATDGSILRIGGYGHDNGSYPARKRADLFEPAEIFANPAGQWKKMAAQQHERRYHSVAITLPRGEVLSGGGNDVGNPDNPVPSWWSVEVFSPRVLFRLPRPRITSFPTTAIEMGTEDIEITAILKTTSVAGEFRVALLAPGAATHAFDQSQKYIKLDYDETTLIPNEDPDGPTLVTAYSPAPFTIPPGWYMLVVVNSSGIPSVAKWIQLTL